MTLYQDKYRVESARLQGWDYRSPGWYFVTICARDHICIFGDIAGGQVQLSPSGEVADSELRDLPHHYVNLSIDHFIVMPNHIHAIVVIDGQHRHSPNPNPHRASFRQRPGPDPTEGRVAVGDRSLLTKRESPAAATRWD